MSKVDLLCFIQFLVHKKFTPEPKWLKMWITTLWNVFENRKYSLCYFICVTYTCIMTSTVVGLFIRIGVVMLYLEQLSCVGKFFKIHTMPAIFYKKLTYKFVGVMKNNVDGTIHQNFWESKRRFEIFNLQILFKVVTFSVHIIWPFFEISFKFLSTVNE